MTTEALPPPLFPYGTKQCSSCLEVKPWREFYQAHDNRREASYRSSICKDCENTKERPQTLPRLLRNRARHRATALLLERHPEEFKTLLEQETQKVWVEHEILKAASVVEDEMPRLRPGARRDNQTPIERIDVARCTICQTNHDRGHRCPRCGHQEEEE